MLKEISRYDYVAADEQPAAPARATRGPSGPRFRRVSRVTFDETHEFTVPLQAYLAQRFAFTGKRDNKQARLLRAENARRHNLAAARGNWPMNRTS